MSKPTDNAGAPVVSDRASDRIRKRLERAGQRFHANDNIAEFVESDAELDAIEDEVTANLQGVLEALVIDTVNDHNTQGTARRVARMFVREVFNGRFQKSPRITEFPNAERLNELMIVGPITVRSACSHHLCPILGKLWIGVLPNEHSNLIGLSKYARIADWIMSRPQIQEEAIIQLADGAPRPARWVGPGDGSRSLLHAVARRQGRIAHDQQRDARLVSDQLGYAPGIFAAVEALTQMPRSPCGALRRDFRVVTAFAELQQTKSMAERIA